MSFIPFINTTIIVLVLHIRVFNVFLEKFQLIGFREIKRFREISTHRNMKSGGITRYAHMSG